MGHGHKFDVGKLDKLRDPGRLIELPPDKIWTIIGAGQVKTLVDIGAGIGTYAIPFARKMPHGTVHACDISEEMIGHLKGEIKAAGAANVLPVLSGEVRVPLADGLAEVVTMMNLHHELDKPEESLAECLRLLKPGGLLAIIDWKPQQTPHGPPVKIRIPPERVLEQMSRAGFVEALTHDLFPYHYMAVSRKPPE